MTASSVGLLRFFNPPFTSFMIWDSNFFEKEVNYNWTPIRDMGKNIILSVVATEDSNFCDHLGVDIKEIYRVIRRGEKRGASTITQQLAKNIFLWPGRSWSRKFIELYFTLLLEIIISKRRILEIYLNVVEEGGETEFLSQKKRYNPVAYTALLWPGSWTHQHRGNPPLSGDKYILTGWYTPSSGMPRFSTEWMNN